MHTSQPHYVMSKINCACIEQDNLSKILMLLPGDILPKVMHEYTDACASYFEQKDIPEDRQVHKILAGIKDIQIKDWITANCLHLQGLTFDKFIAEFRQNYLDEDWENATCHKLLTITQGSQTFWDFAVRLQAKNSLLTSTASHLDEDKLYRWMEAWMDECLPQKCAAE
jgi:hypothetical protein